MTCVKVELSKAVGGEKRHKESSESEVVDRSTTETVVRVVEKAK